MTPTFFLGFSGIASLFIGILGILDPALNPSFWFDAPENIVHTGFGFLAFFMMMQSVMLQRWFVLAVSVLALSIGIGGLLVQGNPEPNFFITNLENPIDNALHLTFAVAGFCSVFSDWWRNR